MWLCLPVTVALRGQSSKITNSKQAGRHSETLSQKQNELSMVVYVYNPTMGEDKGGGWAVQGQSPLHSEFEATLGYCMRVCLKTNNSKTPNQPTDNSNNKIPTTKGVCERECVRAHTRCCLLSSAAGFQPCPSSLVSHGNVPLTLPCASPPQSGIPSAHPWSPNSEAWCIWLTKILAGRTRACIFSQSCLHSPAVCTAGLVAPNGRDGRLEKTLAFNIFSWSNQKKLN